jgi:hypothetical protein
LRATPSSRAWTPRLGAVCDLRRPAVVAVSAWAVVGRGVNGGCGCDVAGKSDYFGCGPPLVAVAALRWSRALASVVVIIRWLRPKVCRCRLLMSGSAVVAVRVVVVRVVVVYVVVVYVDAVYVDAVYVDAVYVDAVYVDAVCVVDAWSVVGSGSVCLSRWRCLGRSISRLGRSGI